MGNDMSLLERSTVVTTDRSWNSIAEASDFFNSRSVRTRIYKGSQLSVGFHDGLAMLGIKGEENSEWIPIRDSGMEGLLQRSGLGLGNFPMQIADEHLIQYNLNYLFHNMVPEKEFTVLFEKNPDENIPAIKAVMSDKFSHIPHLDVLNIISNLEIPHEIHSLSLTKDFFRINVTNPANKAQGVKVGDISSVGIDLLNSETGHASLWMGQFIYRYWCKNGASRVDSNSSFRTKAIHKGYGINNILSEFRQTARQYLFHGADQLQENFRILSSQPVTESFLNKVTEKTVAAIGKGGTDRLMDEWEKSIGKKACDEKEWTERKMEKYEDNRYDFTQLVTASAHRDYAGLKRLNMEKIGGWLYSTGPKLN